MLSHPLVQEAAETLFVPLAIKNNSKGDADAEVLAHFGERAWNNPVVYCIDADERPLAEKLTRDWSVHGVVTRMATALEATERPVPEWLRLLTQEEQAQRRGLERAVFSQT